MDFPALGDADAYAAFGQHCAAFLAGSTAKTAGCYNAVRPVGINVYHAIPYLLTKDDIAARYIALLMNTLCLTLLVCACVKLVGSSVIKRREVRLLNSLWVGCVALVVGALTIGFVPVQLSDLPAASLFVAGLAILREERFRTDRIRLLIAGLLCGTAALLRQNYIVPMFFLVVAWFVVLGRGSFKAAAKSVSWYLCGCSIVLIQVLLVFHQSGTVWFYEPWALKVYAHAHQQPYVELVAYTQPVKSAYAPRLSSHVAEFQFWLIRLYEGVAKFYWAVYSGVAPLEKTPEVLVVTPRRLALAYGLFACLLGTAAGALLLKNKWLTALVMSSFLHALFIAATNQTENRHYLYYKLVLLIFFVTVAQYSFSWFYDKVRGRSRWRRLAANALAGRNAPMAP
jgi:hypothetical protein